MSSSISVLLFFGPPYNEIFSLPAFSNGNSNYSNGSAHLCTLLIKRIGFLVSGFINVSFRSSYSYQMIIDINCWHLHLYPYRHPMPTSNSCMDLVRKCYLSLSKKCPKLKSNSDWIYLLFLVHVILQLFPVST